MKKSILGLLLIGLMVACSSPATRNQLPPQADASIMAKTFPPDSGTWHFSGQRWKNGIHFCEYRIGRNKVISRIEDTESCPSEITAPAAILP